MAATRRPEIHAIFTGRYLAGGAALAVLEAGGNVIDAGIAPIMIWHEASQRVVIVSGFGRWPAAASSTRLRERYCGKRPQGVMSTFVPAAPGAWPTALELWGTISLADALPCGRGRHRLCPRRLCREPADAPDDRGESGDLPQLPVVCGDLPKGR